MLANATRICEAKFGFLFSMEGDAFRTVAMHGIRLSLSRRETAQPAMARRSRARRWAKERIERGGASR